MNQNMSSFNGKSERDHAEKLSELKSIAEETSQRLQQLHSKSHLTSLCRPTDHFEFLLTELTDGRFDEARLNIMKRVQWHIENAYEEPVDIHRISSAGNYKSREEKILNEEVLSRKTARTLKNCSRESSRHASILPAQYASSRNKGYHTQNTLKIKTSQEKILPTVSKNIKSALNTVSNSNTTTATHTNFKGNSKHVNRRRTVKDKWMHPPSSRFSHQESKQGYSVENNSQQLNNASASTSMAVLQKVQNPSIAIVPLVKQTQPSISLPPKRNYSEVPLNQALIKVKHSQRDKGVNGINIKGGQAYENLLHALKENMVRRVIERQRSENPFTENIEANQDSYEEISTRLRNQEKSQIYDINEKSDRKRINDRFEGSSNIVSDRQPNIFLQQSQVETSYRVLEAERDSLSIPTTVPRLITAALKNTKNEEYTVDQATEPYRSAFFREFPINFVADATKISNEEIIKKMSETVSKTHEDNRLFDYSSFSNEPEDDGSAKTVGKEGKVIDNQLKELDVEESERKDRSTETGTSEETYSEVYREHSDISEGGRQTESDKEKQKEEEEKTSSESKNNCVDEESRQENANISPEYSSDVENEESVASSPVLSEVNGSEGSVYAVSRDELVRVSNGENISSDSRTPSRKETPETDDDQQEKEKTATSQSSLLDPEISNRTGSDFRESNQRNTNESNLVSVLQPLDSKESSETNDGKFSSSDHHTLNESSKSAPSSPVSPKEDRSESREFQSNVEKHSDVNADKLVRISSQSSDQFSTINASDSVSGGEIVFPSIEIGDVTISEGEIEFEASISHMQPCNLIAIKFSTKDAGMTGDVSEAAATLSMPEQNAPLPPELLNKETQTGGDPSSQISSDLTFSEGIMQPESIADDLAHTAVKQNEMQKSSVSEGEIIGNYERLNLGEEETKLLKENEILRHRLSSFTGRFCVSTTPR